MTRPRLGLTSRLFLTQALVVAAGAVTLGLVAVVLGPAFFHDHFRRITGEVSSDLAEHAEEAYVSANALSTGTGLVVAMVAAGAASALVARRVARPIRQLAAAAADISSGRYSVQVPAAGLGDEFDTLAEAFNDMATRLRDTETTRRRMLADLGHEMRTPIATIEAYLEAMEDGLVLDDAKVVTVLRAQTARLRRLSDDVSAVSRAEEHDSRLNLVRLQPDDLVRAAVTASRPHYDSKGVSLDETIRGRLPAVHVDSERMGQVLGNLLDNALRHTPPGGRVTVSVTASSAEVRISVTDTGEGIAEEHLPHVFERFYRADGARDRQHGGSGIGLAIVKALVHAHQGRVHAYSAGPATGARFTVHLPAVPDGSPPSSGTPVRN